MGFNENRVKKLISILENRDGIRFSEGVINDNREVDFFILQTKDKVEIHNNYRASFYESDIPFEKLNMVPVSAIPLFKGNRRKLVQLLEPDKTFVFRTRDGTFAKMVVLEEHIAQTYSGRPTHMFVSLEDAPSEKQNIKLWMVDTSDNKLIWNSSIQAPGTFDISDLPKKVVFPDKDFYLFLESDRYVSQAHRLTKVDGQLLFFKNIDSIKLSLKRYAVIEYAFFEGNNTEFTGREPTTSGLVTVGPGGSLPHFGRNLRFGERSDPTRFGSGLRFDCYGNSPNKGVTLPVETLYDKMSKAPEQGYRCNHIATSIAIAKNKGFYTKVVDNKGEAIRFGKIYVKDIVTEPTKGTALRIDRQLICGDRGPKKQVDFLWDSMWYGNYSGSLGPLNAALKLLTMQDESMDMLERELLPLTLSEERLRRYLKDMESEDDCIRQEAVTKLQYYDPRLASNSFEIMGKISSRLVRLEIAGMLMGKGLNHYKTNGSYDIKIKRKGLGSGSFELQAIGPNSQILSISNPNKRISDIRKIEWKRVLLALSVIQFMDDKERVKKILKSVSSGHIDALPTQYARSIYKRNYSFFSFQNTSISEQVEALYRDDHLAIEAIMSLSQASDEAIHALKPLVRNSLEQGKSKEIQKHLYAFLLLLEKIDTPESIAMIRVVADGDPKIPYTQAAQAIYNRITRSNHYSVPFNLARE